MSQPAHITVEDLEKAASVRLFEKVAAANSIDLDALDNEQLQALYTEFEQDVLPSLIEQGQAEKQAAAVQEKIAGLSEEQVIALFEKQAAAEPGMAELGGLEALDDEQLKVAFAYFAENMLPIMAAQDWEVVTPAQAEKIAAAQEVQVKLAEADMLGRHMARAFADESAKLAMTVNSTTGTGGAARAAVTDVKDAAKRVGAAAGSAADRLKGLSPKQKALGAAGIVGASGLAALGAKKLHDSKKEAGVLLTPEDVDLLSKLAAAGDLAGLQKAAGMIAKAASDDGDKDECATCKKDPCVCEKGEEKGKGGEKEASALSAVDLLVEQRATDLAREYLVKNGFVQE